MTRLVLRFLLIPLAGGCAAVATLETAVPPGQEISDSTLLGTWEITDGSKVTGRATISEEGTGRYMVRLVSTEGTDSWVLMGRLGALGAGRRLFELSPVGHTASGEAHHTPRITFPS